MLTPEQLKPFILHPIPYVRRDVMRYFEDGWIHDPEIVPLVLKACDQFGNEDAERLLLSAYRQPLDHAALSDLLGRLERSSDPKLNELFNRLLLWIPVEVLRDRLADLEGAAGKVTDSTLEFAKLRLSLSERDGEDLYTDLCAFAAAADEETNYAADLDQNHADALVEALARHNDILTPDDVLKMIEEESAQGGSWLEIFLIDLAGARKMNPLVPRLLAYYHEDEDYLLERIDIALIRIGDPRAIHSIRKDFPHEKWGYRNQVADLLGSMKLPEAEAANLELLAMKSIPQEFRSRLAFNLCDLFSPEAIPWGRRMLAAGLGADWDDFRRLLIAVAEVNGLDLPEKEQWLAEVDQSEAEIQERIDAMENSGYFAKMLTALARNETLAPDEIDEGPDDEPPSQPLYQPSPYKSYAPATPYRRPTPKIGPNQPCPCGSGKKYKKCCGKPA